MHLQLAKNVFSVGVVNPNLRVFDIIMPTEFGTSYNAYMVKGEKVALIEASHSSFCEDFLENISEIAPLASIDYIVLNHTEPDHSGSVAKILALNPNITIVATAAGLKNLKAITGLSFNSILAKDNETLDLGGKTLKFIIAPNLHWPDSMFTYLAEDSMLFPCDFLGAHFCELRVFADKSQYKAAYESAFANYYNAIFSPFKPFVLAGLDKLKGLEIKMVCPSHGPVLIEGIAQAMALYRQWSTAHVQEKNVAIFYVSAYGYTKAMAEHLTKSLIKKGILAESYDIINYDLGFLKEKLEQASAVCFGSPTINRDALKPVWDLLSVTDAINNKGKPCAVFGSYGWSGEAFQLLQERLLGLKLKPIAEPIKANFTPKEEQFMLLEQLAELIKQEIDK